MPAASPSMSTLPEPFEELTLEQLRTRTSIKWSMYEPDVLPLWVAEMDAMPAPSVVEAITDALRRGDTGYPSMGTSYADALAAVAARRWGWELDVSLTQPVADVLTGVFASITLLTEPGDALTAALALGPGWRQTHEDPPWRVEIDGETLTLAATDRFRLAVRELTWSAAGPDVEAAVLGGVPGFYGGLELARGTELRVRVPSLAASDEPGTVRVLTGSTISCSPAAPSLRDYIGPEALAHIEAWKLEDRYVACHVSKPIPCNWKLNIEAFMEAYHVPDTHPQVSPTNADVNSQYDVYGMHVDRFISTLGVVSPKLYGRYSEQDMKSPASTCRLLS